MSDDAHTPDARAVLRVTGPDRAAFLQGLVTNDVDRVDAGLVYTALLSPQGKYLADFFMVGADEAILLDVAAEMAPALAQRLAMYKLRAAVAIEASDITVTCGLGPPPPGGLPDPRHEALGWRAYGAAMDAPAVDWDALRVEHMIPEAGRELHTGDSFILEYGFERLNGVDFKKGCYVGQEVTARMKHKTELKKGLARVAITGAAEPGAEIMADGKPAGTLYTRAGDAALAYLRFDRATGPMQAGGATITRI
ncbi:MAG: folate-binding protein [Pseudomonadota bacterium]